MAIRQRFLAALAILGLVLGISAIFSMKGPLQDVHWDAPIYVGRAKEFAQTPYLTRYVVEAPAIAEGLSRWKIGEDTPYWGFLRLGNTILLGLVSMMMGANIASIYAGFWLYTLMVAGALVCSLFLVLRVTDALGNDSLPRRTLLVGAIMSGALYLTSDAYRYLSGNQVSEVPALLLLGGAALALVRATVSRSIVFAAVSGTLAFILYVVRMEAVWAYLSFLLAYAGITLWQGRDLSCLREASVSASTALVLYMCYAWLFWPLADPRLLLVFTSGVQDAPLGGVPAVKLLFAAGGPLWIGLLFALAEHRRSPALWLASIWLLLVLIPHSDALLGRRQTEMRMYAMAMPPLLIASSVGWAAAIASAAEKKSRAVWIALMAIGSVLIITLAHAESYQLLRQLPGAWRLQYVRAWLSPPSYERLSYPVQELQDISNYLYARPEPAVVIPEHGRLDEHLRIIWYLAPEPGGGKRRSDPEQDAGELTCRGRPLRPAQDHVVFCSEAPEIRGAGGRPNAVPLLYLRQRRDPADAPGPGGETTVYQTKTLELVASSAPR